MDITLEDDKAVADQHAKDALDLRCLDIFVAAVRQNSLEDFWGGGDDAIPLKQLFDPKQAIVWNGLEPRPEHRWPLGRPELDFGMTSNHSTARSHREMPQRREVFGIDEEAVEPEHRTIEQKDPRDEGDIADVHEPEDMEQVGFDQGSGEDVGEHF